MKQLNKTENNRLKYRNRYRLIQRDYSFIFVMLQVEVSPIAQKAEAETTYDDDEGVKKTEEEKKEEYKRNTIKRNSARRAQSLFLKGNN